MLVLIGAACTSADDDRREEPPPATEPGPGAGGSTPTPAGGGGGTGDGGDGDGGAAFESVTVGAWNLEHFPLSAGAVEAVAALLSTEKPDVIGLEEIDDLGAFAALDAALPDYEGIYADDPGAYTRVALLYRTARVEVSEVRTLFANDWYAFPRPPLDARLRVAGARGGTIFEFDFVVVHLKAYGDDESRDRRMKACVKLDAWIRDQGGASGHFIVAGDWNDKLTDPPETNVFGPFLGAPDTYRFLTAPLAEAGAFSYIPYQSLIDHVLVTTTALDEYGAGETEVLAVEDQIPGYLDTVSDHRPVLSHFLVPVGR